MKLAISVLIVLITSYLGYSKGYVIKRRIHILEDMANDIVQLGKLVEYKSLPINELLTKAQMSTPEFWDLFAEGIVGGKSAEKAWIEAVERASPLAVLKEDEKSLLKEYGLGLGLLDRYTLNANAGYVSGRIRDYAEQFRREEIKKCKMYSMLGVLSGMAISLMVW